MESGFYGENFHFSVTPFLSGIYKDYLLNNSSQHESPQEITCINLKVSYNRRMSEERLDPLAELEAMKTIAQSLSSLERGSWGRVLHWACDRFLDEQIKTRAQGEEPLPPRTPLPNSVPVPPNPEQKEYNSIAQFYSAVSPDNDAERVLCIAYWFQVIGGESDVDSQTVNKELKHLGHGVANVTSAFTSLITRKPQLVIQTRKSGTSQQARKRFLVTAEGKKFVEARTGRNF